MDLGRPRGFACHKVQVIVLTPCLELFISAESAHLHRREVEGFALIVVLNCLDRTSSVEVHWIWYWIQIQSQESAQVNQTKASERD